MVQTSGVDQVAVLYYVVAAVIILIGLVVIGFVRSYSSKTSNSSSDDEVHDEESAGPASRRVLPTEAQVRRVGGSRNVRSRLRGRPNLQDEPTLTNDNLNDNDDDDEDDVNNELPEFPSDVKIGAKKRKKLEMKAEKKANREYELHEREERKKRQEKLDEQRQKEEEAARLEEIKQQELERQQKEEKERREREEYEKMKQSFAVESEGFDQEIKEDDSEDMLRQFIKYIEDEKVIYLEDLASRFRLKTQEAINRVNALLKSGDITGVIDDRGKFIYISMDELESVAKFIKQRGRVTITELAECSNQLINMNPSTKNVPMSTS